uniref:Uncharacterized protein n=1 Tax=Timema monikensis TaxID=170555 RepID=A0A7R9EB95_9NEOP|nr:unnamed protein product [Timema monikensis]
MTNKHHSSVRVACNKQFYLFILLLSIRLAGADSLPTVRVTLAAVIVAGKICPFSSNSQVGVSLEVRPQQEQGRTIQASMVQLVLTENVALAVPQRRQIHSLKEGMQDGMLSSVERILSISTHTGSWSDMGSTLPVRHLGLRPEFSLLLPQTFQTLLSVEKKLLSATYLCCELGQAVLQFGDKLVKTTLLGETEQRGHVVSRRTVVFTKQSCGLGRTAGRNQNQWFKVAQRFGQRTNAGENKVKREKDKNVIPLGGEPHGACEKEHLLLDGLGTGVKCDRQDHLNLFVLQQSRVQIEPLGVVRRQVRHKVQRVHIQSSYLALEEVITALHLGTQQWLEHLLDHLRKQPIQSPEETANHLRKQPIPHVHTVLTEKHPSVTFPLMFGVTTHRQAVVKLLQNSQPERLLRATRLLPGFHSDGADELQ